VTKETAVPADLADLKLLNVEFDGRTFRMQTDMTVEQDLYVMDLIERMGLTEADLNDLTRGNQPEKEKAARSLILGAYRSGELFKLIGTLMNEDDVEWTPEVSEENAELFATMRDKKVKAKILKNLTMLLLAFFTYGLPSSQISQSFSMARGSDVGILNPNPEAVSGSANGNPSSVPSPERPKKSVKRSRGQSAKRS
jgi:hypothetical protein